MTLVLQIKVRSAELSKMNSMPTLQKVKKQFEDLSAKEAQLSAKISQIKSGGNSVDPQVREAIKRDHEIFTKVKQSCLRKQSGRFSEKLKKIRAQNIIISTENNVNKIQGESVMCVCT